MEKGGSSSFFYACWLIILFAHTASLLGSPSTLRTKVESPTEPQGMLFNSQNKCSGIVESVA